MKKRIVLLSVAALFIGNTALAIVDTGENSLGVYFDAGTFEENCIGFFHGDGHIGLDKNAPDGAPAVP